MNSDEKEEIASLLDQIEALKVENSKLEQELNGGDASKTYMWPPPADHAEDVLCVVGISLPCRVVAWIVKSFDLPVDICGIDFAKDLNSPECLEVNPVHSLPFLVAYSPDGTKTGVNGSEAIADYLCSKYRTQVPDSFYPSNPLRRAKVLEIFNFVHTVMYRATMYQYVYPCMGLMSECQYDICKRDFSLKQVEGWASSSGGKYFFGDQPSLADFELASLWLGNNWVADAAFDIPWKHKDVIDKYPATKTLIDAVLAIDGVSKFDTEAISESTPSIELWNSTIAPSLIGSMLMPTLPALNGRKFKIATAEGEEMIHPNAIPYVPGAKEQYDVCL